ncbi:hypothetical protein BC332_30824 [Capsicum chinense]|nr:hypothetical protein BC332_30824 [Capsicum chinense]
MDTSLVQKRHLDTPAASTPTAKRRHLSTTTSFRTPPPPPPPSLFPKLSPGETFFKILCPADKTGGLIGKGGATIRQVREETGAKIRIDDSLSGCDERVIVIIANCNVEEVVNDEELSLSMSASQAQRALIRVFERILKVDEEGNAEGEGRKDINVVCRLLAPSYQVGCVLGRGGKVIEKIRLESGAQVRSGSRSSKVERREYLFGSPELEHDIYKVRKRKMQSSGKRYLIPIVPSIKDTIASRRSLLILDPAESLTCSQHLQSTQHEYGRDWLYNVRSPGAPFK